MRIATGVMAAGMVLALAGTAAAEPAKQPSAAQLKEARQLATEFFSDLKGELQKAIAEGGPTHAVEVCARVAPGIAGELSTHSGWAVGRTALKVRNPRNSPSVRERAVLMAFKQRVEAGEPMKTMESAAVIEEGGRRYLHYMKAIPTKGVCLTCHGETLSPALKKAIDAEYPADAATGFELGELRGAFTFVKPLE
ncbi:Protein of unknown function [Limimonas halophila]|uniref:Tll0287-like domain-containing protein n=1 Tax=Limimonas halophila TaxID=1082479 RepID=A0A1G7TF49_9PROT|nr:DUF3365 domain-containing protein [Limimonas halophila]SDG33855.1 Protein of unknown function [Limimonas halophila]